MPLMRCLPFICYLVISHSYVVLFVGVTQQFIAHLNGVMSSPESQKHCSMSNRPCQCYLDMLEDEWVHSGSLFSFSSAYLIRY